MSERLDKAPSNRKPVGGVRSGVPWRVQRIAEEACSTFLKSAIRIGIQVTHDDTFCISPFGVSPSIIFFSRSIPNVRRKIGTLERLGDTTEWPSTSRALRERFVRRHFRNAVAVFALVPL